MAIKPLQTITLKDDNGDDITYTLSGEYPDLIAGSAEQIISDEYTENKVPYLLRASDFGSRREDDTLVGGTVAFNQTAPKGVGSTNVSTKQYDAETGITTITPTNYNGDNVGLYSLNNTERIVGHKYYVSADVYADYAVQIKMGFNGTAIHQNISATTWTRVDGVQSYASASLSVYAAINSAGWASGTFKIRNVMCFDLTRMFGSTIADYIYSLEQATAGAGVAWFRNLFPKPYYAYSAGELLSVSGVSEHKMVGFNAWDEETQVGYWDSLTGVHASSSGQLCSKNYIPIISGNTYYFYKGSTTAQGEIIFYDANKNYIGYLGPNNFVNKTFTPPKGSAYAQFNLGSSYGTTYKGDICINLSSSRNGQYEPYKAMSYPLDDSLTLRGIPKLDGNNNLYYDGDTYESDGTVTRKHGIVDLGSLTWSRSQQGSIWLWVSDLITDMVTGYGATTPRNSINVVGVPYEYKDTSLGWANMVDKTFAFAGRALRIRDDAYTTATAFTTAMSGVYIVYQLATPTTETADPYTNPQNVDPDGTEEYVSTSIVPVGHNTKYFADLVERLAAIPEPPTANGTYRLIATVSGGVATLSWVAN